MTKLATREDKLGNLVKMEFGTEQGYCREMKTVTLTSASQIGDVLVDNAGNLELVAVATTGSAEAVLADTNVYSQRPATGTSVVEMSVLVRGPVIVADGALKYNADINTASEIAALHAVLEGLGILVREQV